MAWFELLDLQLFRLGNQRWTHDFLDLLMPVISGSAFVLPILLLVGFLLWRRGRRGRLCLVVLLLVLAVGDGVCCKQLKKAIGRDRPCRVLADARVLVGCGSSGSMPSGHAANWFAATTVMFWFYRRTLAFTFPLALLVSFSRIYLGVHYPSDVFAGALLGTAYAAAMLWGVDALWRIAGRRWFPLWQARLPSLLRPDQPGDPARGVAESELADRQWLRLGYVVITSLLIFRWVYIASGAIELSEDEAYQWLWSKHLDLSYYSKPPLIAYAQWLGTSLWGDTEFGVRFFSPVIAAVLSVMLLRFFAREVNPRVGFVLIVLPLAAPILAAGATLMTIDSLSVLFWTAAMLTGWRAVQLDSTRLWIWTGVWTGLGFLSKYVGLFQWVCWALFFILFKPARAQLRRPGLWLAVGITLLATLPVVVWNAGHGWITLTHLEARGNLGTPWKPTLNHLVGFLVAEAGLLNPVFLGAAVWAALAFWKRHRHHALMIFCFSMGAPLFLFYLLFSLRSPVQGNWIAPSIVPLFALMVLYWQTRWQEGTRALSRWLAAGLALGGAAVVVLHHTELVNRVTGQPLPLRYDPLRRVQGWQATAEVVETARARLEAQGETVFVIGDHYGITSLLSFYLPAAKRAVAAEPQVFCRTRSRPDNQFFFWPGYGGRQGQNAIYVQRADQPRLPPPDLASQFASVTDLGVQPVLYRGRVIHSFQLFECRGLR